MVSFAEFIRFHLLPPVQQRLMQIAASPCVYQLADVAFVDFPPAILVRLKFLGVFHFRVLERPALFLRTGVDELVALGVRTNTNHFLVTFAGKEVGWGEKMQRDGGKG